MDKRLTYIISLFFLIFLTLFYSACGGGGGGTQTTSSSTPEATIENFSLELETGNVTEALNYASLDSQERLKWILDLLDDDARNRLANALLNATRISESEDTIIFKASMTNPDGSTVESTFIVVLENGNWKITGL